MNADAIRHEREAFRGDLMVVYLGAEDCAPCRVWQRDVAPAFRATPTFQRISYREVKSPRLFDLLNDEYWPEDLRAYRAQLGQRAGAPMWLIVLDRKIVGHGAGVSAWQEAVMPKIKALTRRASSG
jgi:hypothetical protein